MEYNQYLTIDDFFDSSYNDQQKFDTKGPATEYKWKGKMNHLSPIVAQKLKCFVKWMTHDDRIPSTTPGAEPPRDPKDSGSARSHSTHLETSSSN